ncbi:hypothetical protein PL8927_510018 [Planktothrix serta PCC 8927]|uniref:Uncharacterized protein n=1 Tax=Planktothrix serta PCC 8927 TaxID=671068 RepID=A0A7Z9BKC4_9CYAN|nr:hypothetical protein PL8927_510018 [Planktothrix serta PCC 8927]
MCFCIYFTHQLANTKRDITEIKNDVNNLGALIRQNRASIEGKLVRFITETATRFRQLNADTNFTYPNEDK